MNKEEKFYQILEDVFAGAKIEGKGGFVNLMKIKHGYYSQIKKILEKDIDVQLRNHPKFKEEIFNKLYSFFNRYFSENGSIYFNSTPFHNSIYERVYTEGQDISLFWKTNMLYYIKTDSIFKSIEIDPNESDNWKLLFDVSSMEHKKVNEKRSVVYTLNSVKDGVVKLEVSYSKNRKKTDIDGILKSIRKEGLQAKAVDLEKGFHLFEKQTKVDYFINKNAKEFLMEQFKLWSYQYFWQEDNEWTPERVEQLRLLKIITYKVIDFISQFENELGKIWNKPKFVRKSNYVITLDKITDKKLVEKIVKHPNFNKQLDEWKELDLFDGDFRMEYLDNNKYSCLPIDTKHFLDMKFEILSLFNDLDNQLDGRLIKSENYQALNTLMNKYSGNIKCIYIDPPFNLGASNQFDYYTDYKDSCWATLLENRLFLAKDYLRDDGTIFIRCDYNGNWIVRCLLDEIFGKDNFCNEIIVNRTQEFFKSPSVLQRKLMNDIDSLLLAGKSSETRLKLIRTERDKSTWHQPFLPSPGKLNDVRYVDGKKELAPKNRKWGLSQEQVDELYNEGRIDRRNDKIIYSPKWKNIKNNWTDISGYSRTHGFDTENSEDLLSRVIYTSSDRNSIVADFFAGSGTTMAVAQKLQRKWLGVEMGEQFYDIILPRMKQVVAGRKKGISKESYVSYTGGGFFKYYELEQYEDTLSKCKYADSDVLDLQVGASPYQEYVFMKDEKMTEAITIDYKNNKVKVDLNALYPDIDIAETISNLKGKNIKKITANEVEFTDNTKINTQEIDYKDIKPLIWWE